VAPDAATERDRLLAALEVAADQLEQLALSTADRAGSDIGAIFEAQALFARDPGIVDPALGSVDAGSSAVEAIERAAAAQADVLAGLEDEYLRERAADVRDVGRRVADILLGRDRPVLWHADGRPAVVVAVDLDPSDVATLRPELVSGIALGGGAPTGHATIVARALGIPLVLGLGRTVEGLAEGVRAVVDGGGGRLIVEPEPADQVVADPGVPSVVPTPAAGSVVAAASAASLVQVAANVGSALEAEAAARAGADGIGLVRTELLFLGRTSPPGIEEQRATYARIQSALGGKPVVFRTLDVGGDKPAAWQGTGSEMNPALGVRGVRLGLRRPELLEDQLLALLRAHVGRDLRVMVPMVATREELDMVRAQLDRLLVRVGSDGPTETRLGIMIEVPSAAVAADVLAPVADFFSIGTNDLVQYTLAADRTNPELADLGSALQPAVLRLIDRTVTAARDHDRHVSVCGEAAADPEVVPLLVGLGVDELSVAPASVGPVRAMLDSIDPARCRELAAAALVAPTLAEVRSVLGSAS
jgi:phosphoenolpyruvate-protein phosphotransferase